MGGLFMEMGLTESTMLLWSVVLGLVQIVIATMAVNKDVGLPYNLSSRDEPSPAFGKVAGRLVRAGANFRETFGLFAVSVIMVIVLHRQSNISAMGRRSISGRAWSMCRSMPWASRWCAPSSGPCPSSAW
jgi:uncharacterized MAPEG superfamily protein